MMVAAGNIKNKNQVNVNSQNTSILMTHKGDLGISLRSNAISFKIVIVIPLSLSKLICFYNLPGSIIINSPSSLKNTSLFIWIV